MRQSKRESLRESITNVAIGYSVAVLSQLLIFPIYDIHTTLSENFGIAFYFTIISITRSYCVRRYFTTRGN